MKKLQLVEGVYTLLMMSIVGLASAEPDSSLNQRSNSWTGIYAGANAGVLFNHVQLSGQQVGFTNPGETCHTHSNFSTFFPGIQLGYLREWSNHFVSGLEANATINTNQTKTLACQCPNNAEVSDQFPFKNPMQGSIRGRLGHELYWNNRILLPYLTTGVSVASAELAYQNEGGDYYVTSTAQAGWLIGTGIEWAFRQNASLRAEYSYVTYGNGVKLKIPSVYGLIDPKGNARAALSANTLLIAINYWF